MYKSIQGVQGNGQTGYAHVFTSTYHYSTSSGLNAPLVPSPLHKCDTAIVGKETLPKTEIYFGTPEQQNLNESLIRLNFLAENSIGMTWSPVCSSNKLDSVVAESEEDDDDDDNDDDNDVGYYESANLEPLYTEEEWNTVVCK
jgi:hypothetical protein